MITNLQSIEDFVNTNPGQKEYEFTVPDAAFFTINKEMAEFANVILDPKDIAILSVVRLTIGGKLITVNRSGTPQPSRESLTTRVNNLLIEMKLAADINSDDELDVLGDHLRDWINERINKVN